MPRIRVIDTETQGLEQEHLVCEFGWCDLVNPGDGWRIDGLGSRLCRVDTMPPEARAAHHISAEETQAFPAFDADEFWASCLASGVDVVAAHNWAFDSQRLGEPKLPAACTYKAALRVWPQAPAHGNGVLRYWLQDQGLINIDPDRAYPPHRAGPDAYVTANILLAALAHAKAGEMVAWTREPALLPTCPIGEWRGKPWPAVDAGFLRWMINKPVEPDLVWNAQRELERRRAAA